VEILHCDKDIVVAVKPRGVLSEEQTGEQTMPALLREAIGGDIFTVHRLDRAVGGVMVYARNKKAAAALSAAIQSGELQKVYTAVVTGTPDAAEGEWRDHLYHDQKQNKTFVADHERKGTKEAILEYRLLDKKCANGVEFSRISIKLLTGRSHQIRVQFASRGLPLVGDGKYGSRQKAAYLALCATRLTFPHPKSKKLCTFEAPTPTDFPWDLFTEAHFEIERKFLIAYPDTNELKQIDGCRVKHFVQTYLTADDGESRRVREVREGENVSYIYTRKRRVSDLRYIEEENELTEAEYQRLLADADPASRPILKTRYAIPYKGHVLEIDLYEFWQDRATLEVELSREDEDFAILPSIKVIREVTSDHRYKNVNLARNLPSDPLS
jgi:23S rRNA pseudouridine1911/1915/1917 synthase